MKSFTGNTESYINGVLKEDKVKDIYDDLSILFENHKDVSSDDLIYHIMKFVCAVSLGLNDRKTTEKLIDRALNDIIDLLLENYNENRNKKDD